VRFFPGLHHPSDAANFERCFISVNAIKNRKSGFRVRQWIMDCAGFSTIMTHGDHVLSVADYAAQIRRWKTNGRLLAAVAQDYMCEPQMLARTGLTIAEHQRRTIERYDELVAQRTGVYIMPVLQGWTPDDYVSHIRQFGRRLRRRAWVGVGSICKRNKDPQAVVDILRAIHRERPDLRLHGFGLKKTALAREDVREHLETADSMSWSYSARKQGRDANDWREAEQFRHAIDVLSKLPDQLSMLLRGFHLPEVCHV
jgi:hypothetical protein